MNEAASPPRERTAVDQTGWLVALGLKKSFGKRAVVENVSLAVRRGEAVGLLGPNGAGKTTVFTMIMGLVKPDDYSRYSALHLACHRCCNGKRGLRK